MQKMHNAMQNFDMLHGQGASASLISLNVLCADGGNVELVEIDGPVVYLRLQGACGSCPSSLTTMTMGIKRRLQEKIPVCQ